MNTSATSAWADIIVGHVLPSEQNINVLRAASKHFASIGTNFRYAESSLQQGLAALFSQDGEVASRGQEAFAHGEYLANEIAAMYEKTQENNDSAHNSANALRADLLTLAMAESSRIEAIRNSNQTTAVKVAKITEIISESQGRATLMGASCAGNILENIQDVLDNRGNTISARQFMKKFGLETSTAFSSTDKETIRKRVKSTLNRLDASTGTQHLDRNITAEDISNTPGKTSTQTNLGPEITDINTESIPGQTVEKSNPANLGPNITQIPSNEMKNSTKNVATTNFGPSATQTPAASLPKSTRTPSPPATNPTTPPYNIHRRGNIARTRTYPRRPAVHTRGHHIRPARLGRCIGKPAAHADLGQPDARLQPRRADGNPGRRGRDDIDGIHAAAVVRAASGSDATCSADRTGGWACPRRRHSAAHAAARRPAARLCPGRRGRDPIHGRAGRRAASDNRHGGTGGPVAVLWRRHPANHTRATCATDGQRHRTGRPVSVPAGLGAGEQRRRPTRRRASTVRGADTVARGRR